MDNAESGQSVGADDTKLREVNEALLVSLIHQHELAELARRAEAALRTSEAELRLHAEELDRFNRAAVGRESRIIELKKELNEAANRHGESAPYRFDSESAETLDTPPLSFTAQSAPFPTAASEGAVPLAEILYTEELTHRASRQPDYETENRAIASLVRTLADSPAALLQVVVQTILATLAADSAGLSLLTPDEKKFYWPAIAGMWNPDIGGGTPRDFGPCGDVLDRNAPLLFQHPERRYQYFAPVTPPVAEALLVPFYVKGRAVGTLWAVAHGEKRFDAEDLRQLESLSRFASAAYQASELHVLEQSRRAAALNLMEDAIRSRAAMEKANLESHSLEERTRQLARSLADLNRRKDEFLAMLSHELRNPLASIRTATHVMRLQPDRNPTEVAAHAMVDRQVAQLVRLIDDLLEVSRIATGRVRLQFERIDLRSIVHRAVETIRPQADQKRQSVAEPSTDGEPIWLDGDAVRLEQVVVNLLSNASKYTDRGGRITLTLQEEGGEAVLRVRDTGAGIAPEMLPRIFDMFTQANVSLDRAQGGLGIGLALVRSMVELHHGTVEAHSTLGQGSEFVVRLPRVAEAQTAAAVPVRDTSPPAHTLKVLVVDDNVDAAESMFQVLHMSGHTARVAHDGGSALDAVREFAPDVVLLDIGLPVLDGYEVARRIRQDPTLSGTVLVALTGYGKDADKEHTRDVGFDHHLVKPVDFASLVAVFSAVGARLDG